MWAKPSAGALKKLPQIYEQEEIKDKIIHGHFFVGGCDWYVTEFDGKDQFFGFAILNNDFQMAEWGYFSLAELKEIKIAGWCQVDWDRHWTKCKASEVDKIVRGGGIF